MKSTVYHGIFSHSTFCHQQEKLKPEAIVASQLKNVNAVKNGIHSPSNARLLKEHSRKIEQINSGLVLGLFLGLGEMIRSL